ncbi:MULTISPECIES: DUF5667 domain-containing protein [Pseudonocardia]|uniref:DUF5667 domain-containing protein n=2 Tax=Pseudonocardia TaxID=1847 RepID=A0A1Y2N9M5_PSEAH|nr:MULTISPECIES: DUF5667 domain-containing protein [Pseudonocardia]OSY44175.1 hypothetical protein BG845_00296 [Pseudonocardia autotrophica]TDN74095.1 hypothetical protein C8E95_3210 [Pseudonocardia autotrophica]BBG04853.1 hypothetical protein Pdca_60620 [Pseudonocardia autotrophica]GEC23509.1 hypothetical protein PSA01_05380 [Pseudonocardia saturnea]
MPRAWDDRHRGGDDVDRAPAGAPASEELAHEIALSAALDRSRRDLSPDPHASARMRQRLFEVLAQEGVGQQPGPASPFGGRPGDRVDHLDRSDLTAPIGPPIADDLDHEAVSTRRSAGEHQPESDDPGTRQTRPRRGRHVLPTHHPDHPEQVAGAAPGPARDTDAGPGRDETSRPPRMLDRRRPSVRKRFGVIVGGFAALAVIAGVTSTVSRDALPGDAMYGVKRASESVGGVFTVGEQAEADRQLDLARSRVDELENLIARATPPSPNAVAAAMKDFDRATSTGSRLMLTGAGAEGSDAARLAELRTWAAAQSGRITGLQEQLPAESRPETAEAIQLLDRVLARAEALRANTGCIADSGGTVDDLGPVPGECRTGSGTAPGASRQSATATPDGAGASSGSGAPSSETTEPETSSPGSGTSEAPTSTGSGSSEPNSGLPLLGGSGPSTSSSPSSSSPSESSSSTPSDDRLLPPITIPPLLPGLGPVTIG